MRGAGRWPCPAAAYHAESNQCPARPSPGDYSQYTNTNSPSQTTSTKCQYHATASKAKWLWGEKCHLSARPRIAMSMIAPMVTWKPWKPVRM